MRLLLVDPRQSLPPKAGAGLSQNRLRSCHPPSHVLVHPVNSDHKPHFPSTEKGIKINNEKLRLWQQKCSLKGNYYRFSPAMSAKKYQSGASVLHSVSNLCKRDSSFSFRFVSDNLFHRWSFKISIFLPFIWISTASLQHRWRWLTSPCWCFCRNWTIFATKMYLKTLFSQWVWLTAECSNQIILRKTVECWSNRSFIFKRNGMSRMLIECFYF